MKKKTEYIFVKFSNDNEFKKAMELFDENFINYIPIYSNKSIKLEKTPNYKSFLKIFDKNSLRYHLEENIEFFENVYAKR